MINRNKTFIVLLTAILDSSVLLLQSLTIYQEIETHLRVVKIIINQETLL